MIMRAQLTQLRALLRKKPMLRITSSTSSTGACAMAAGFGQREKSSGVTLLTLASVVWALRATQITHWKASSKCSAHSASGYSASMRAQTSTTRALLLALLSWGMCSPPRYLW